MTITLKEAQSFAAENHLKRMLKGEFFNILDINSIFAVYGLSHWDYRNNNNSFMILRALHCTHFKDMTPELRSSLPVLIADACSPCPGFSEILFKYDMFDQEIKNTVGTEMVVFGGIDGEVTEKKRSWFGFIWDWRRGTVERDYGK